MKKKVTVSYSFFHYGTQRNSKPGHTCRATLYIILKSGRVWSPESLVRSQCLTRRRKVRSHRRFDESRCTLSFKISKVFQLMFLFFYANCWFPLTINFAFFLFCFVFMSCCNCCLYDRLSFQQVTFWLPYIVQVSLFKQIFITNSVGGVLIVCLLNCLFRLCLLLLSFL